MSIVENMFDQHVQENLHCAESERHHLAVQQVKELLALARELERHCEAMAKALFLQERESHMFDDSQTLKDWQKFKQERG